MADIVNIMTKKLKALEKRAFSRWKRRFGEYFNIGTALEHVSDSTLFYLASPGKESSEAFYEIILGAWDISGGATKYYHLENTFQLRVTDIHLFIADQAGFEIMHRLKWLKDYPCREITILNIVMDFDKVQEETSNKTPVLSAGHPGYSEFMNLIDREREAFVRRLLPEAIEKFGKIVN